MLKKWEILNRTALFHLLLLCCPSVIDSPILILLPSLVIKFICLNICFLEMLPDGAQLTKEELSMAISDRQFRTFCC